MIRLSEEMKIEVNKMMKEYEKIMYKKISFVEYFPTHLLSYIHKFFHGKYYSILHDCEYPIAICVKCSGCISYYEINL